MYYGIDGCKNGWLVMAGEKKFCNLQARVASSLSEITAMLEDSTLSLLDMPIGLPCTEFPSRRCDRLARKILKHRRSSIFPVPGLAALSCDSFADANKANREEIGVGLSKQTWNITQKIREVTEIRKISSPIKKRLYECHPELCFAIFNKGEPLQYSKKSKEGIAERVTILQRYSKRLSFFTQDCLNQTKRIASSDDIVDAAVLLLTATQTDSRERLQTLGELDQSLQTIEEGKVLVIPPKTYFSNNIADLVTSQ